MNKELLQIEFRYTTKDAYITKNITIGIFDNIKEAVKHGNLMLKSISKYFEVRENDIFKVKVLFGLPNILITNCCYPTKEVQYFARIKRLDFKTIDDTVKEAIKCQDSQ